jgi:oligopeptidase B
MLITAGLNDPRVAYWEPAKFAAKLREMKTDDNLLLLHTNYDAGHAGASGRYDHLKEVAIDYAFLIDRLCTAQYPIEMDSMNSI